MRESLTIDAAEGKPGLQVPRPAPRPRTNPTRSRVCTLLLLSLSSCWLPNAGAQSFGGPTKLISQDYAPVRSSLAVDSFGDIYVAYDVWVSRTPTPTGVVEVREIRLARSTDGGATFTIRAVASGQTRLPSLAVSAAGNIYIAYLQNLPCDGAQECRDRPASARASIQIVHSPDGENFSSPVQVSTPGVTNVDWETNVALDGAGKVYVVWSESDTTDPEASFNYSLNFVRMRTSSDQAQTFAPPVVIHSDPGAFLGDRFIPAALANPSLAVTPGGQIHATWSECKTNDCSEFYYRRSLDGESFSLPLLIDRDVSSATFGAQAIAVDAAGRVSVAYVKDDSTPATYLKNVYHARIENGVVRNPTNISAVPSEFEATEPTVAIDRQGRIYVAWSGPRPDALSRSEPNDIFMRRSSDGGQSFSAATNLSNTPGSPNDSGHSYQPAVGVSLADTPLVVWGDNVPFCSVNCFTYPGELHVTLLDSDQDRLPDQWEKEGVTVDGEFIDLPRMGANPLHKDIFIHADWMARDSNPPRAIFKPAPRAIKIVTDAFDVAPIGNPDGTTGVILHVDLGSDSIMNPITDAPWGGLSKAREVPFQASLGFFEANDEYNWGGVDTVKMMNFDPAARSRIFHYALFCNTYGGSDSSGIARGIPGADFLVTLGTFPRSGGTEMQQAGTFMHELGHNLGLRHGGSDDINRKPNYLSIMNYAFQFTGVFLSDDEQSFNYSAAELLSLDELNLDEFAGISDPALHRIVWNCKDAAVSVAGRSADWNCDGTLGSVVMTDINGDGTCVSQGLNGFLNTTPSGDDQATEYTIIPGPNRTCETTAAGDDRQRKKVGFVEPRLLNGYDDWPAVVFDGGGRIASAGAAVPNLITTPHDEPTMEELLEAVPPELVAAENSAPLDVVTTSNRLGTAPWTVTFDGTASTSPGGTIVDWQWQFGDGTAASGAVVTHTYPTPGRYFAKLTVTDSNGQRNLVPLLHRVTVSALTPAPTGNLTISGRVTDGNGNGLSGVTMTLQIGGETRTILTDSNGNYSFSNLAADQAYRVTASKFRFRFDQPRQAFDNLGSDEMADFSGVQVNFRGERNGKVAFASSRDSIGSAINFEIYATDPDGANQTRLTNSLLSDLQPAWSPDGTQLVFTSQRDGNVEIYAMNSDGSAQTRLTNNSANDNTPVWSPDGTRIAFSSNRAGSPAIYLMNADGSAVARITNDSNGDARPSWSPDGTRLVFQSARDGDDEIYIVDVDGRFQTRLTDNSEPDRDPAWSPDGTKIAFISRRDGNAEIYRMDADGSNQVRLTNNPATDEAPAWSPDGLKITFDSDRDDQRDIYIMNANGGSLARVTGNPAFDSQPDWQPQPVVAVPQLLNISTRLRVLTGDNALIGGFIVTGTQQKKVIIRAIGPSLPFGERLANPTLELRDSAGTLLQFNDDWQDSPNKQEIMDSTIPPTDDLESAIVATLPANSSGYTAIVRGVNDGTGIGLVEAYDLDLGASSTLANISTRGLVQTDDNVLIAGTIVLGETAQKVIVRAIGPSLSFPGVLADPILELRDANGGLVRGNDNWRTGGQEAEIIATTIPPTNDFESAIVATLPANGASYTAIVRGVNNTTGIAVVEVYALN